MNEEIKKKAIHTHTHTHINTSAPNYLNSEQIMPKQKCRNISNLPIGHPQVYHSTNTYACLREEEKKIIGKNGDGRTKLIFRRMGKTEKVAKIGWIFV